MPATLTLAAALQAPQPATPPAASSHSHSLTAYSSRAVPQPLPPPLLRRVVAASVRVEVTLSFATEAAARAVSPALDAITASPQDFEAAVGIGVSGVEPPELV